MKFINLYNFGHNRVEFIIRSFSIFINNSSILFISLNSSSLIYYHNSVATILRDLSSILSSVSSPINKLNTFIKSTSVSLSDFLAVSFSINLLTGLIFFYIIHHSL